MQIAENLSSSRNNGNAVLPAVLRLTLTKKWFDIIASGEKKEEYRQIKWYWISRFTNIGLFPPVARLEVEFALKIKPEETMKEARAKFNNYDYVEFKNGYSKNAPLVLVEFKGLKIGESKKEWSDYRQTCFVISLGKIVMSRV